MASVQDKQKELWLKYAETHSPEIREKLIVEYSDLVKIVAGRLSMYFGGKVEYDDLVGYGVFGLIDAIEKFDISKGVKFETYASLRIRGAIIDSIREMDWVPRSLRQKSKELEKAYFVTGNELGRAATDKEVAEHLGISVKQLQKDISEVSSSALMSLEDFLEQNYEIGVSAPNSNRAEESPEQHAEMEDLKKILGDAIDKLTEREKLVVTLYYFEELTLKEISAIMGVSESRVSQLHSRSILRLKGRLDKHKSLF